MNTLSTTVAGLTACLCGVAWAGVTTVAEFEADAYETFENVAPAAGYQSPLAIFGGDVLLGDMTSQTVVIALNWSGPAGVLFPFNGNLMGGTPTSTAYFEFSTAVTHFGGYFGTVSPDAGGTAVFYDENGDVIDSLAFTAGSADWAWLGWESDVGISRIELTGNLGPAFGFQYDDLQLRYVPSPAGAGLLAGAAMSAARRRRN